MSLRSDLRRRLDAVVKGAGGALRRHRAAENAVAVLPTALRAMIAVPGLALLVVGVGWLFGRSLFPVDFTVVVVLTLLAPVLVLLAAWLAGFLSPVTSATALATVDRELGLEERLLTAEELLQVPERTPFMEAALDDAAEHAWRATEERLQLRRSAVFDSRNLLLIHGAIILLALLWFVPRPPQPVEVPILADESGAVAVLPKEGRKKESPEPGVARPETRTAPRKPKDSPKGGGVTGQRGEEAELEDAVKETRGRTTTGKSSEAASASGSSDSKGAPSNQAQASDSSKKKSKKKPKKPAKDKKPEDPSKKPSAEDQSGSTAGRGAATGSNKSPAASKWSSKDQVTSEDEEDIEDDEDVDDEVEEDEARGGVQPGLRDRKPPVNRDLTIGFGNMKNPDANGRGGPGDQKKSRGVATLVLGVPIPDHVKGKPNPGKTKITQERVEPEAEEAERRPAAPRNPRQGDVGPLARPDLLPWMRQLLRDWFPTEPSPNASE